MHDNDHSGDRRRGVSTKELERERRRHLASTRAIEVAVAAVIFGLGLLVISDSRRVGYGWAADGPQAGYFPFYIGLILCAASAWALLRAVFSEQTVTKVFVGRKKKQMVLSVFIPSLIYVISIYFIGIYVASALFIGAFMYWHGKFTWIKIISVSLLVPVSMFLLFELWFLVPLPKGPLEALAGY